MLLESYKYLKNMRESDDDFFKNAYIEIFLLHYRNLANFFADKKKYKTDITWVDYKGLNSKEFSTLRNEFQEYIDRSECIENINRRLSHITSYRENKNIVWPHCEMMEKINNIIMFIKSNFESQTC